ncbi:hypothetical protein ABFS83_06G042000 [Erythranthe nasuta]
MEDSDEDCYVNPEGNGEEERSKYEFDAPQFYDFTRSEFDSEIDEAERWFDVSGNYPPSPFIVKLNLEKLLYGEVSVISAKAKYSNKKSSNTSDSESQHGVSTSKKNPKGKSNQDNAPKLKTKSADKPVQPKSSTLMEPTASHLAKQHKVHDKHSGHICTRLQKISAKLEGKSSHSSTILDNSATKRQKLEIGYLRKVAHLKHKYSLLHKSSKKVTVPKEPELETMLRAQRRGSKNSSVSSETEKQKQKDFNFKAHPLNKKILQTPSLLQRQKSTPRSPEFQVFNLKTTERAHHHASTKEPRLSTKQLESPPTEQLSKLSLGSDTKTSTASSQLNRHLSAKGLKKDGRESFQAEFWKCHTKPSQCGGHTRVHDVKHWSCNNMARSLDIR